MIYQEQRLNKFQTFVKILPMEIYVLVKFIHQISSMIRTQTTSPELHLLI